MSEVIKRLNRYTTLPYLLDYLQKEKLVLLDPESWDDKNDTELIKAYKEKANISKLFALCFSFKSETIHHWKSFANGASGCCIEFDAEKLLKIFDSNTKFRHGEINYHLINEAKRTSIPIRDIPFCKRKPYEPEGEYRVIWEGKDKDFVEIDIPLKAVRRITFSQQMQEPVFESVKAFLTNYFPVLAGKIIRSTVYENKRWINNFKRV